VVRPKGDAKFFLVSRASVIRGVRHSGKESAMNTLPSMTTNTISIDDASQMSDSQALAAFASKGDPAAFAMLTQRYQRMVLATCARVTRSQADAEDAAQETFLKLARKAGEIHGSAAAWLHAAAMGTSLDLLRRKRAMQRAEYKAKDLSKLSDAAGGDEASDTATSILWNALEPALDDALATLSDEDRDYGKRN
jgi:RNA polymerase sigma factor (sigma-70 family)